MEEERQQLFVVNVFAFLLSAPCSVRHARRKARGGRRGGQLGEEGESGMRVALGGSNALKREEKEQEWKREVRESKKLERPPLVPSRFLSLRRRSVLSRFL